MIRIVVPDPGCTIQIVQSMPIVMQTSAVIVVVYVDHVDMVVMPVAIAEEKTGADGNAKTPGKTRYEIVVRPRRPVDWRIIRPPP